MSARIRRLFFLTTHRSVSPPRNLPVSSLRHVCVSPRCHLPVLCALAASAGALGAQQAPPEPLPLEELDFPAFEERLLANGADLIVVPHHEQPFVTVNLVIRAGNASDPRNRVGVASMVAGLLTQGTEGRTALEIADASDDIGATLTASAADDWTSIVLGVVTPELDAGLALLGDIVANPRFSEDEIGLLRQQTLTGLQLQLGQAGFLADRELTRAVYGRHPYGLTASPETIQSITRSDLVAFHRRHYKPTNALVVVAGDVTVAGIEARLNEALGSWEPGASRPPTYFTPPVRETTEVVLVHRPESLQSVVRVGQTIMKGDHGDWIPMQVGNQVLGGSSSGRLFKTLREEKGWTYGAYSQASRRRDVGVFIAGTEVRTEVTDSAVAELLHQIERMRTELVPEEDLADIKSFLVGSFPLSIETPQSIASQVAAYRLRGRSTEELEAYRGRVSGVGPFDVRDALGEHILPDRAVIVVVGDATLVRPGLAKFGPLRMVDVEGGPLTLDDIEVRASDTEYDPSVLEPGQWRYQVTAQGRPVAELLRTLSRKLRDGEQVMSFSSSMSMPNMTQATEVFFSPRTFRPIASTSRVITPQGERSIEMEIVDGRVRGRATGEGLREREIDREVVQGALLGEMQELVAWISDLEDGQEIRFPVVSPQSGGARTITIRVRETTEITVPAGTFEVIELSLSGGGTNERAYVMVDKPHVLVRLESAGRPVVIELKEAPTSFSPPFP